MYRIILPLAATLFVAVLCSCEPTVEPCKEFDPPPGHKPSSCPSKPAAQNQPAQPVRYCYRSLAQEDCYSEPQPGRTGYMGATETAPTVPAVTPKETGGKTPAAAPHSTSTATPATPAATATPPS